jgi:uncharacterized protein DUF4058
MDPYLEHPSLWPDVHNRLIAALADDLSDEPEVALNRILHALYQRARFDLRLDYTQPPGPPLTEADVAWAQALMTARSPGQ